MEKTSFKAALKSRWVVGAIVLLSLGMGEFHTRSNATSKQF